MFEAVDGMNDERAFIFTCFGASTCHMHMPTCTAVSQSSPHSYQRSTWSTYRIHAPSYFVLLEEYSIDKTEMCETSPAAFAFF